MGGRKTPGQQQDLDVQVALKMQQRDKFAPWQAMTHADQHPPPPSTAGYRGADKAKVEFCQICLWEVNSCEWTEANSIADPPASRFFAAAPHRAFKQLY